MPVPHKKKSKSKTKMRRANYNKVALPTLVECYCEKKLMIPPHKACPHCGLYKDNYVISVKTSEEIKEKRRQRKEE
jgi:large subunit ribosomal protein L32